MNIVRGTPPNYRAIVAVFPAAARHGVIFTYGTTVYVNGVPQIPTQLKAHEAVHSQRQGAYGGPEKWWEHYLVDPEFRLTEELVAHRAEYRTLRHILQNRKQLAQNLDFIAERLSSPLYGAMITKQAAKKAILA